MSCFRDPLAFVRECPGNSETGRRCWITANDAQYALPNPPCAFLCRLMQSVNGLPIERSGQGRIQDQKRTAHACLDEGGG